MKSKQRHAKHPKAPLARKIVERLYIIGDANQDRFSIVTETLGLRKMSRPTMSRYLCGKVRSYRADVFLDEVIALGTEKLQQLHSKLKRVV